MPKLMCPRPGCGRVDGDIGGCGRHATPCPPPVPIEDGKTAVIRCGTCNLTRAMPVSDIIRGKSRIAHSCPTTVCNAVLLPTSPTKKTAASKSGKSVGKAKIKDVKDTGPSD